MLQPTKLVASEDSKGSWFTATPPPPLPPAAARAVASVTANAGSPDEPVAKLFFASPSPKPATRSVADGRHRGGSNYMTSEGSTGSDDDTHAPGADGVAPVTQSTSGADLVLEAISTPAVDVRAQAVDTAPAADLPVANLAVDAFETIAVNLDDGTITVDRSPVQTGRMVRGGAPSAASTSVLTSSQHGDDGGGRGDGTATARDDDSDLKDTGGSRPKHHSNTKGGAVGQLGVNGSGGAGDAPRRAGQGKLRAFRDKTDGPSVVSPPPRLPAPTNSVATATDARSAGAGPRRLDVRGAGGDLGAAGNEEHVTVDLDRTGVDPTATVHAGKEASGDRQRSRAPEAAVSAPVPAGGKDDGNASSSTSQPVDHSLRASDTAAPSGVSESDDGEAVPGAVGGVGLSKGDVELGRRRASRCRCVVM